MAAQTSTIPAFLDRVRQRAEAAGVFASCRIDGDMLVCEAQGSAEPAFYRIEPDEGKLWVALVMEDRWLSESIEAELMHTGDKLEELIEEELVDLGYEGEPLPFQHYRSADMLFTFRSPIPIEGPQPESDEAVETAAQCLLAYEACFRNLGDMSEDEED